MLTFLSQNPQNRQNNIYGWGSQTLIPNLIRNGGFPAAHGCAADTPIIEVLHCFAGFVIITIHCVVTSPDSP